MSSAAACPYHAAGNGSSTKEEGHEVEIGIKPRGEENIYAVPSVKPGLSERLGQRFKIHVLRHPNGIVAWTGVPKIMATLEAAKQNFHKKRLAFGLNFAHSGGVVMSDWDDVVKALTEPQARTFRLGTGTLDPKRFPAMVRDGDQARNLFLLAQSQKGAGGNGIHEDCQGVIYSWIINPSLIRQSDSTAKSLIAQLAKDYKTMPHGKGGSFFTDLNKGLCPFMIKYLHYCLFGISPDDEEKIGVLLDFYYRNGADKGASPYYLWILSSLFNLKNKFQFTKMLPKVVKIYEESPALLDMPMEQTPSKLSRNDVAHMLVPIMSIAGTLGPMNLLRSSMGFKSLVNAIDGVQTEKIDVPAIWDTLDLDDTSEVERFLSEVGRLRPPVGHTHHVATKDITVKMLGKDETLPAGTIIIIPLSLTMSDKNIWGDTTYEFDHNRQGLLENNMIFHSVGADRTNGRICPGRQFAITMMTEIIVECGKVRREAHNLA